MPRLMLMLAIALGLTGWTAVFGAAFWTAWMAGYMPL